MSRSLLLLSAATFVCLGAAAQDDAASTEAVYACAQIGEDAERLACYDAAVGRLKAAEEAGEVTTISRADVDAVQRESFGFSLPSLPKIAMPGLGGGDDELDHVTTAVSEVRADPYGKAVVTLDNGQVWRQIDDTRVLAVRRGAEEAEIQRAALGSFKMKLDNGRSFRARRVQ